MQVNIQLFKKGLLVIILGAALWFFYFLFSIELNYDNCTLCDKHQYTKIYEYFKYGSTEQIAFPFYKRPLVPFLASLLPLEIRSAFHLTNFILFLLSIGSLFYFWKYLGLNAKAMSLGFGWLMLHWTGIIRYNLMDYVTVDVALYALQALALVFYFQKKYLWFYIISPLAILQKESFIAMVLFLVLINIFLEKKAWWRESKHLVFSLMLGLLLQKVVIDNLPAQENARSSLMDILYHLKLTWEEPQRIVRWIAALGASYGVLPILLFLNRKSEDLQNRVNLTLLVFSGMYLIFGLTAGDDMTRILFLGFPFLMTLILINSRNLNKWTQLAAILLSLPALRLYPFHSDVSWAVDYAQMPYVLGWTAYYFLASILLVAFGKIQMRQTKI